MPGTLAILQDTLFRIHLWSCVTSAFDHQPGYLFPACLLKNAVGNAAAFFAVLTQYTLADLVKQPDKMRAALRE